MSTMLVYRGTASCLWVYETLDPDSKEEQGFTVVNGEWYGKYYDGIIETLRTGHVSEVDLYNDFNREGDYNTVINRFREEVLHDFS